MLLDSNHYSLLPLLPLPLTLSVSMVATTASNGTLWPGFTIHFANTPCVIDSPMVGTKTSCTALGATGTSAGTGATAAADGGTATFSAFAVLGLAGDAGLPLESIL